jgi:hypothetical protein
MRHAATSQLGREASFLLQDWGLRGTLEKFWQMLVFAKQLLRLASPKLAAKVI